jgi:hypothetical protein
MCPFEETTNPVPEEMLTEPLPRGRRGAGASLGLPGGGGGAVEIDLALGAFSRARGAGSEKGRKSAIMARAMG